MKKIRNLFLLTNLKKYCKCEIDIAYCNFILRIGNVELSEYIGKQFLENPFLIIEEASCCEKSEDCDDDSDLLILEKTDNCIDIFYCSCNLPSIAIDEYLIDKIERSCFPDSKNYMHNHLIIIDYLLQSLEYRENIMLRVAREIIYRQRDFFCAKIDKIERIPIETISNSLLLSKTTINYAVENKYIQTQRGSFIMSDFVI